MTEENPHQPPTGEDSASPPTEGGGSSDANATAVKTSDEAAEAAAVVATTDAAAEPSKEKTTKTLVLTGFGGYDKIRLQEKPYPEAPTAGQVMIRVHATGINFADISMRQGVYHPLPTLPVVMGFEAGAEIIEVGPDVKDFKVGDRVICIQSRGLWTEFITVDATSCWLMPAGMTYDEAAALPVNYITAYHILFDFGNLRKGKSVLIHMAAGGVGIAATQLAKTVPDVTVYGTASAGKHEVIKKIGVDHPIDYRTADYVDEIKKIDPEGVDIVMDPLSGKDSVKGFELLKPLGKIIHFGAANALTGTSKSYWSMIKAYMGVKSYNSFQMIDKNRAICGYHLGYLTDKPHLIKSAMDDLLNLYKQGKIKPHIDSVWGFVDVELAMRRIQERQNIGKVVLSPQREASVK